MSKNQSEYEMSSWVRFYSLKLTDMDSLSVIGFLTLIIGVFGIQPIMRCLVILSVMGGEPHMFKNEPVKAADTNLRCHLGVVSPV